MKKLLILSLLVLSGCTMKSQVINLSETPAFTPSPVISNQAALVKVEDKRDLSERILGYRAEKKTEESSLMVHEPLSNVLTKRLKKTLTDLGFGGEDMAVATRIKLSVDAFNYQCKPGLMTQCKIEMKFVVEVFDDNSSFKKPYSTNETRSLTTSPVKDYNQQWVNEKLDEFWKVIFSDGNLLKRLAQKPNQSI